MDSQPPDSGRNTAARTDVNTVAGDAERPPWEQRDLLGPVRSFWLTWKITMLSPSRFWQRVPREGPVMDAFSYGWLIAVLGAVVTTALYGQTIGERREHLEEVVEALRLGSHLNLAEVVRQTEPVVAHRAYGFITSFAFYPIAVTAWTLLLHLTSRLITGGRHGFWSTFRVVAYSYAPALFIPLPYVGVLAWGYLIVVRILGVRHVLETSTTRAAAAVILVELFPWLALVFVAFVLAVALA